MSPRQIFSFPDSVNEVSARLVASGVVIMTSTMLITGWTWMLWPLALGFIARVLSGPTLSPLGQFVTRVITPALGLEERPTPGPPKRFAQGIGATFSVAALVSWLVLGSVAGAQVLVSLVLVAASLEAFLGYCLGCKAFGVLMRAGVIPEEICLDCADISRRIGTAA